MLAKNREKDELHQEAEWSREECGKKFSKVSVSKFR